MRFVHTATTYCAHWTVHISFLPTKSLRKLQHQRTQKRNHNLFPLCHYTVFVAPGQHRVISLPPEFITPQDGHNKQDCENAAAKRWITEYAPVYGDLGITILGDDLYCRQPICTLILDNDLHFILVCNPIRTKRFINGSKNSKPMNAVETLVEKRWTGKTRHTYTYRFVNKVPVRDGEDALEVNWCELTITSATGKRLYKNAFATDFKISKDNVKQIVAEGRTRWKIENENNNILKTRDIILSTTLATESVTCPTLY